MMIRLPPSTTARRFYTTTMLRRKLSAGLLRASKTNAVAAGSSSASAVAAASPMQQQQSAGLVSAVLLNSQRNWKGETVVTLKTELKRRGLSQTGNKCVLPAEYPLRHANRCRSVLVARLTSADISGHLPPVPPMPSSTAPALRNAKSLPALRQLSTSSAASASKSTKTPSPTKPQGADQAPVADPVDQPVVTSTGPAVVSQKTEAAKPEPVEPEMVTVAPGLPETKASEGDRKSLDVQMPGPRTDSAPEQVIVSLSGNGPLSFTADQQPLTPDNFRSNDSLPKEKSRPKEESLPKVTTAASTSTHEGGGPSHALHESSDPHELETRSVEDAAEEALAQAASKLPSLTSALSSVVSAPGKALKNSGISASVVPEIGAAQGFYGDKKNGGSSGTYKADAEPLKGEEKSGAYVLAGVLGFGLLGALWPSSSKKSKKDGKHGDAHGHDGKHGKKGGAPLGDDQWAKASGAEVVGHGHRKV